MKLFQINRKYMEIFGIHPPRPNVKNKFNLRNVGSLSCFVLWIISSIVFVLHNENSLREYATCFQTCSGMLAFSLTFLVLIERSEHIFPLFEKLEKTTEHRTLS